MKYLFTLVSGSLH